MANALCSFTTFLWLALLSRSGLGLAAISTRLPVSYGCSNVKLRTLPSLNVLNDNQAPDLNPVEAPATRGGFLSILDRNNAMPPPPIPENSRPYEAVRNSVAISAFVALTAWTVLTVDSGIARGWTLGEVRRKFWWRIHSNQSFRTFWSLRFIEYEICALNCCLLWTLCRLRFFFICQETIGDLTSTLCATCQCSPRPKSTFSFVRGRDLQKSRAEYFNRQIIP